MKAVMLLAAASALACSTPTLAQDPVDRPLTWHLAAGFSPTVGRANRYFDNGWIFSGGLDWRPRPDLPLTLRLDGHYSAYDATNELIEVGSAVTRTRIDDGDGSTLGADLNAIYDIPFGHRLRAYISAGAGVDRRRIDLTQTALFNGVVCDPFWGLCGVGVVAGDVLVARDSTTRFAWNAGLGIEIPTRSGTWFVDARYRQIETEAPMAYVPIQVGLRF
jgi:opacity protein-like surface antigen